MVGAVDGDVGKRIRKLRLERGLTLRELEARSGVSRTTISLYERGKARMSLEALEKVARALEVSLPFLLSGDTGDYASMLDASFLRKLSRLSPEGRKSVMAYVEFLLAEERKRRREGKGAE